MTVEDPIEYELAGIGQTQVNLFRCNPLNLVLFTAEFLNSFW